MPIYEFGLLFIVVTLGLGYLLVADGVIRGTSFFHRRQMDQYRQGRSFFRRLFTSFDTLIVLAIIIVIAFLIFSPLLGDTSALNS